MAVAAELAVRAWINARPGLTGDGNPLPRGAYLAGHQPRSPAFGAYALLLRTPGSARLGLVAEDQNPSVARITATVYAGSIDAAEAAAVALANAWQSLNGRPEPCGNSGVIVMVTDNHADPSYLPQPADAGEQHAFTVAADFVLYQP